MAKYRVWAEMITDCYVEVEAESEEDAMNIAEDIDGGDFVIDDGDWKITHADEI